MDLFSQCTIGAVLDARKPDYRFVKVAKELSGEIPELLYYHIDLPIIVKGETDMIILKAKEHNWGLIGPGDWEKHSWKIDDDGWYEYKESYRSGSGDIEEIPTVTEEGCLSGSQLAQLKELLESNWSEEKSDACDGEAWEFKMYEGGEIKKHRELGYIYGIEPFESIAKLLEETIQ